MTLADVVWLKKRAWRLLGDNLSRKIRARTHTKGVDVDGKSFGKYSDGYKKFRAKSGRRISPVTLTFSGDMQRDLQVRKVGKDFVEFGWNREGKKVEWAEAQGRDILGDSGLNKKELEFTAEALGIEIEKNITKWANKSVRVRVG